MWNTLQPVGFAFEGCKTNRLKPVLLIAAAYFPGRLWGVPWGKGIGTAAFGDEITKIWHGAG